MARSSGVRATVGAADTVSRAITTFVQRAHSLAESAGTAMREAENHAASERDARRRSLEVARQARQRAETALAACTENCGGLQRAFSAAVQSERLATEHYHASVQAAAMLTEARSRLSRQAQTFLAALDRTAPGSQTAAAYRDQLEGYLKTGSLERVTQPVSGSGAGGGGSASSSSSGSTSVALADVIDDRPGGLSFEKVSREQVEWGLDVLGRVVEPAVEMGKGPDYFAERDRAEGLSGERSYSGVHSWFYSPTHAIKLTRRLDGRLEVTNGYHRLAVAREMGITNLPAQVR